MVTYVIPFIDEIQIQQQIQIQIQIHPFLEYLYLNTDTLRISSGICICGYFFGGGSVSEYRYLGLDLWYLIEKRE